MYLIQILIPLADNQGKKFSSEKFSLLKKLLIKEFSGLTIFSQSPAEGLWEKTSDNVLKDQIVIFEVMAETKNIKWWQDFRILLEEEFEQESVVIRIFQIESI